MPTSRNQEWREIWEAKGRRTTEELHAIDGYDLLNSAEWEGMIATLRGVNSDTELVDLDALMESCDYVSVRQLLARPFSIIKLDFGTIHRGVANSGGFERVMFWISVSRHGQSIPLESDIEVIPKTGPERK